MFQYRYDSKKDQWNTTRFPVTWTDRHIEEIKSDIDSAQKAVEEYNRNLEYLTRKYNININEEDGIFRNGGKQLILKLAKTDHGYAGSFDVGLEMGDA